MINADTVQQSGAQGQTRVLDLDYHAVALTLDDFAFDSHTQAHGFEPLCRRALPRDIHDSHAFSNTR